jgi:hypothetical protein
MSIFGSIAHAVTSVVTAPVKAVENVASSVVNTAEHAASDVAHAATSAVSAVAHTVENAASSAVSGVVSGAHSIFSLGLKEGSVIGSALGHAAVNIGQTIGHDAASAYNTVTSSAAKLGSEVIHTVGNVGSAIGHGASAIGDGLVHTVTDVASTAGKLGSDAVHILGNAGGDIIHTVGDLSHGKIGAVFGDVGNLGKDVLSGGSQIVTDVAHGAANVASDAAHEVAGIGHAVAEGAGALASGALDAVGTAAGAAGALAKDYEHTMGNVLTNALDSVGAIAKGEVAFGYGTAGIIAHTVGTPLGDFYAHVAQNYGDAAIATLDHVNKAIDDAVNKSTTAGGDIANSLGHGADQLGHDGGQVISDISHGNFSAIGHDFGQFGSDLFDAAKQFAGAEKEGVEALAAIATGINTTLNGLNEAMARAGGGFVSAVGETAGGDAGHAIADAGDALGKATAMTSDLVQGDFEGAAKEGAKQLGELAGGWLGDQVRHVADELGDRFGGIIGDGIKAAGGAAADAIKSAGGDLAGSAADKGLGVINGSGDHAPNADSSGDGSHASGNADSHDSLFDKAWNAVEGAGDQAIHKVTNIFDQATHDPQALLNQLADAVRDHLVKGPGDALGKLSAMNVGSHANGDAHASDSSAIGTSHAALSTQEHAPAATFNGDSVESLFAQHSGAGVSGGHGATLQDVLHGISFSELGSHLLSGLNGSQGGHAPGSEANLFGSHDLLATTHQPEPAVPHVDAGMLAHSEPAAWHNEFAHHIF